MSDGTREPRKRGLPMEYVVGGIAALMLIVMLIWGAAHWVKTAFAPNLPQPAAPQKQQPKQRSEPSPKVVDPFANP